MHRRKVSRQAFRCQLRLAANLGVFHDPSGSLGGKEHWYRRPKNDRPQSKENGRADLHFFRRNLQEENGLVESSLRISSWKSILAQVQSFYKDAMDEL